MDICETWNGVQVNGACLHWGQYTPEDSDKHRVLKLPVPNMDQEHAYGFSWSGRRLVWFIDGYPTMKAVLPQTCRDIREFNIIINVAMGGNVMQGQKPAPGHYDMVRTLYTGRISRSEGFCSLPTHCSGDKEPSNLRRTQLRVGMESGKRRTSVSHLARRSVGT